MRPRTLAFVSCQNNIKHYEETSIKWFENKWTKWSYMGVVFRDYRQLVLYARLSACYIIIVIVYAMLCVCVCVCSLCVCTQSVPQTVLHDLMLRVTLCLHYAILSI